MPLTNIKYTKIPVLEMKFFAGELVSELANLASENPFAGWNRIKKLISDLRLQVAKAER